MNTLFKHAREFASALRGHRYETVGDGSVLFPEQRVFASGLYSHRIRGQEWLHDPNLLPTEGLNYLLDQLMGGGAAAPLYLSLYSGAVTPVAGWTAASYPATAAEITSGTEGYTEAARVPWLPAVAATAFKDNYASVAAFTIATASALNVNGVGLHTIATKGAVSGKLVSSTRFNAVRTFADTDIFDVKYRLALTST